MNRMRLALLGLLVVPMLALAEKPAAPMWTNDLAKMTAPDTPATGKLLGGDFKVEAAKLEGGVLTVERVDLDCGAVQVGEESEVTPVRPQPELTAISESGTAHD